MTTDAKCTIEGCIGKRYGHGLCNRHYMRVRRTGHVGTNEFQLRTSQEFIVDGDIVRIPLTQGLEAIIDKEDLELVKPYIWCGQTRKGRHYASTTGGRLHNIIMGGERGIDHIDHDGLNNRRSNLRRCSQQQNARNRKWKPHSSQYKGVSKAEAKWEARIGHKGKVLYIGQYDTEKDAAMVYNVAAQLFHGDFASLNPV